MSYVNFAEIFEYLKLFIKFYETKQRKFHLTGRECHLYSAVLYTVQHCTVLQSTVKLFEEFSVHPPAHVTHPFLVTLRSVTTDEEPSLGSGPVRAYVRTKAALREAGVEGNMYGRGTVD